MPKGPKITDAVTSLITKVYLQHPSWEAKEVQRVVHDELRSENAHVKLGWPGLSSVQKELTRIRKGYSEEVEKGLEVSWSLGISARPEYGISPEATDDLLAVWKYCLVTGHLFTIREAKWVEHLRKAITDREGRITKLLGLACQYALREQICEILKKTMDTRDLDGDWSIDIGERLIFQALGLIPRLSFPFLSEMRAVESQYAVMSLTFNVSMHTILYTLPDTLPKPISDYIDDLKTILTNVVGLSEQQDRIYSASLLYLSKGPLWKTLSKPEYLLILAQLKQWVTRDTSVWQPALYLAIDTQRGIKPEDVLDPGLLKAVGYEVPIEGEEQGGAL